MMIRELSESTVDYEKVKPLKLNELISGRRVPTSKKGAQKFEVSLQKLLKTHIEKMSAFGSEQKLLKTQLFKNFLKVCC
jgi:hypothetical protein